MRLVGSGAATPRQVLVAAVPGLRRRRASPGSALAALSSWWLVAVGAVCIAAAWTYTGGPLPYGYRALGEVFVFVFFGLVAVVGTTYVQTGTLPGLAFAVVGADRPADRGDPGGQQPARHRRRRRRRQADPGGAARRPGHPAARSPACSSSRSPSIAAVGVARPWALLGLLAAPLAVPPARTVLSGGRGPALIARARRAPACSPWRPASCWARGSRSAAELTSLTRRGPLEPGAQLLLGRPAGHAAGGERLGEPLARRAAAAK